MWSGSPIQSAMLTEITWVGIPKYFLSFRVCYTAQECKDLHGEAMGGCAAGFGTCCVFRYNGAERNREEVLGRKISYIENPTNSMRSMKKNVDIKASNKGGIN